MLTLPFPGCSAGLRMRRPADRRGSPDSFSAAPPDIEPARCEGHLFTRICVTTIGRSAYCGLS
jgi:hypothetical protein